MRSANSNSADDSEDEDEDGRISEQQRELLKYWKDRETALSIEDLEKNHPLYRIGRKAERKAERLDLTNLEILIAGEVAIQAALGLTEQNWFTPAPENNSYNLVTGMAVGHYRIPLDDLPLVLAEAIANLKEAGLWPWL